MVKFIFQAETRIHILEQAVSEAQTSESQVTELQQWIFRVDDLLNDFIEHDTTFECLPHDFQVISSFFYLINILMLTLMHHNVQILSLFLLIFTLHFLKIHFYVYFISIHVLSKNKRKEKMSVRKCKRRE